MLFRVIAGSKNLGLPHIPDFNSPEIPPVGYGGLSYTIDQAGRRHCAYRAFLPADLARHRASNLHICTETIAEKLDLQSTSDGDCITSAVRARSTRGGLSQVKIINVVKEVVLSAGAFGSPRLLMLRCVHLLSHPCQVINKALAVLVRLHISRSTTSKS